MVLVEILDEIEDSIIEWILINIIERGFIMLGNILLAIVVICTFISYLPQTIKLIKTRKSRDISIQSWILWAVASICYAIYAIAVSGDFMLIVETCLELFFCLFILFLSIKYRNN